MSKSMALVAEWLKYLATDHGLLVRNVLIGDNGKSLQTLELSDKHRPLTNNLHVLPFGYKFQESMV